MQALLALARRVAASNIPVLILGETGVGKERIADVLHAESGRSGPLVAVNCAALPLTLAESELFGHVRGAFTGADGTRRGLIAAASGGSLFLDEVGDLDLTVQAKLLRVLEEGEVRMVGDTRSTPVDIRIIAATCRDLPAAVRERRFRDDLYHRLAGIVLTVPPLRDRQDDILPLACQFLADAGGTGRELPDETAEWLCRRPWLGNVRELRQAVRRAVVLGGATLRPEDFELFVTGGSAAPFDLDAWLSGRRWDEIERDVLAWAIDRYGGVRSAAKALGRARSTVSDRALRFGLSPRSR